MSKRARGKPSKAPLCVFCHERRASTRDHVVPKGIFGGALPDKMVTVPVCRQCNAEKSRYDTDLRDYLAFDKDGSTHPTAQELFRGKVWRSLERNQSPMGRAAARATMRALSTPAGIYLGTYPTADIDPEPLERGLSLMVRGLAYHDAKLRIPRDYEFHVRRIPSWQSKELLRDVLTYGVTGIVKLGESMFQAAYQLADSDPATSLWMLLFYDRVLFYVGTNAPAARSLRQSA